MGERYYSEGSAAGPVFVIYRDEDGEIVKERFSAAKEGAAYLRAEFLKQVENCKVWIRRGRRGAVAYE